MNNANNYHENGWLKGNTLMTIKIIIPLPNQDFDPSEVAIPWLLLKNAGFIVLFATPEGEASAADTIMLSGEGLDFWGWIPFLKKIRLIGLLLRAIMMLEQLIKIY